jgi:hypothetical protein
MKRLRETGGRLSATGWGVIVVACDLIELIRRRSLIYASSAATLAILLVILLPGAGGGNAAAEVPATPAPEAEASPDTPASTQSAAEDKFVEVGGYSLSIPDGWHNSPRPPGSAFAATSGDGLATSTLWIRRNPGLDFDAFAKRSKRSLGKLGRNVSVLNMARPWPTAVSSSAPRFRSAATSSPPTSSSSPPTGSRSAPPAPSASTSPLRSSPAPLRPCSSRLRSSATASGPGSATPPDAVAADTNTRSPFPSERPVDCRG